MPDIDDECDEHGCGCSHDAPDDLRYVLHRLPHESVEAAQRRRWRQERLGARISLGIAATWVGWFIGFGAWSVADGDYLALSLMLPFAACALTAGITVVKGSPGVRGNYHHINAVNCALALEDAERKRFGYGQSVPAVDGVDGEHAAEYARLSQVSTDGNDYLYAAATRMFDLKHGVGTADDTSDGHVD